MMIKMGKRVDKERRNTRNSVGTSNENGIKLFRDQLGFAELRIHLLEIVKTYTKMLLSSRVSVRSLCSKVSEDFVVWLS